MRTRRMIHVLATATAAGSLLVACSGAGASSSSGGGKSINVLMVGNPQMEDIQKLTRSTFTKD
ncbi:sugar ABC transporter substrate-binding protein, partial [Streptomyces sp. NPDC001617]